MGTAVAVGTVAAAAGGITAVNLATGYCATDCPPPTHCNPKTGLCDRERDDTACGGMGCPKGKACDVSGLLPECVDEARLTGEPETSRTYKPFAHFLFYVGPAAQTVP